MRAAKQQKQAVEIKDANESSDLDDEEEGGEWVTQENLYKYMANGEVVLNKAKEKNEEASDKSLDNGKN